MSIFKTKDDKDTVSLWKREAKRLEQERNELYTELEAIKGYKNRYESLILEVSQLKTRYTELIKKIEVLGDEYKDKLRSYID